VSEIILPKDRPRDDAIAKLVRFLHGLAPDKAWRVVVEPHKKRRSTQQNAYLWGVCYRTILDAMGQGELAGWTSDDLHEFFLGEHFGWETMEGFGRKKLKPLRRSSKLSTMEFAGYVDFIQRYMAERGVYIPDANEYLEAA